MCEAQGRLQLHTGGKKATATQLPHNFCLHGKSPEEKEEKVRVESAFLGCECCDLYSKPTIKYSNRLFFE